MNGMTLRKAEPRFTGFTGIYKTYDLSDKMPDPGGKLTGLPFLLHVPVDDGQPGEKGFGVVVEQTKLKCCAFAEIE